MSMFKSKRPRELLNEIKWRGKDLARHVKSEISQELANSPSLQHCEIYYIHRGAPDDTKIIGGSEIREIRRSFFVLQDGTFIPYHRIFRINYEGKTIYLR